MPENARKEEDPSQCSQTVHTGRSATSTDSVRIHAVIPPCRNCISCKKLCNQYVPGTCGRLETLSYVCNGCAKQASCTYDRVFYIATFANDMYQNTLISSREGINQEPEKLQQMDRIVSPLIKRDSRYPIFTTAIHRSSAAHAHVPKLFPDARGAASLQDTGICHTGAQWHLWRDRDKELSEDVLRHPDRQGNGILLPRSHWVWQVRRGQDKALLLWPAVLMAERDAWKEAWIYQVHSAERHSVWRVHAGGDHTDDKPHQQCLKRQSQRTHAIQPVTISARLLHPWVFSSAGNPPGWGMPETVVIETE